MEESRVEGVGRIAVVARVEVPVVEREDSILEIGWQNRVTALVLRYERLGGWLCLPGRT